MACHSCGGRRMTGADQVSWRNPSVDKSMVEFKSLRFFTESAKSRMLFRYIVRVAYRAPPTDRVELISWARSEINSHKDEANPQKIRFLVGEGMKRAREMDQMLDQTHLR